MIAAYEAAEQRRKAAPGDLQRVAVRLAEQMIRERMAGGMGADEAACWLIRSGIHGGDVTMAYLRIARETPRLPAEVAAERERRAWADAYAIEREASLWRGSR